ncbi:MAG: hypothetical protein ACKKL6_00830 [Candidatus Komeilibacteria bacterium]
MKVKMSLVLMSLLVLIGCSKFWEDSLTAPTSTYNLGNSQITAIVLGKTAADTANFKSNMWLKSDSSGTEYREVQFSDILRITTMVSEQLYKSRVSYNGIVPFAGFTIAGVEPTYWTIDKEQGPWFWGGIDPEGNFVQDQNNLADTVIIPIEVYAASGNSYSFNGTGTDHDNRNVPWNSGLNRYREEMVTLPGEHRYDFYGSGIDSVRIGNTMIYDISGGYISFEIVDSNQVSVLDDLSGMHEVSWQDTASADSVALMISDRLGDRNYNLINQSGNWLHSVVMPSDTLILLRVEADNELQVTGVKVANTELHHLVMVDSSQYWFAFRLVDGVVSQDSANNFPNLQLYP